MTPRIYGTRMYGTVTGKQRYPGRLFEVRSEVCVTGVVTGLCYRCCYGLLPVGLRRSWNFFGSFAENGRLPLDGPL